MRRRAAVGLLLVLLTACEKPEPDNREAALRDTLLVMRRAIARFHQDKDRHPRSLEELVPDYLRRIPVDPMTGSANTWQLSTEDVVTPSADFTARGGAKPESFVLDVHSGAGAPYSSW